MTREYNELVGVQATFSLVIREYRLSHLYRWKDNGNEETQGTMHGYDMRRHLPISAIASSLREAYAPVILSIWRQVTPACWKEYLQFEVGCTPPEVGLEGAWEHWAQW